MKKSALKTAAIFAFALALPLTLVACGGGDGGGSDSGSGDAAKPLRIGMEAGYAPFNWTQPDNSNGAVKIDGGGWAGGYDVQMAKKIGESMGREIVVVKTAWDGLVPALTSGKIDMIVAGMSPTPERKKAIDFSDYYYTSDIVLVVKKDGPYAAATSLADFDGARITGQLGTIHYDFIDQIQGVKKETAMETFPTMIVALKAGKIDAYVSERPGAESAVAANPDLTFVAFADGKGFTVDPDEISISVGLKKDSPLLADVNKALQGIPQETRDQLMADALKEQPASE